LLRVIAHIQALAMKLFSCPHCGGRLYFENAQCLNCGSLVLYDPDVTAFVLSGPDAFACTNATECGCNWAAEPGGSFCRACVLNKTIPDMSISGNRERWIRVEAAKKRALYSLLAFGLRVGPKANPSDEIGIAFDFLADPLIGGSPTGERVLTGHDNGLITLNVAEADSSEREKMRAQMGENYRTLLGHFRHELGHYYWDRLVRDDPAHLERFRTLFGDESADYDDALRRHYAEGAPSDWESRYISPYAASHPWEDWAETFAHYLHITDTLEMVRALKIPLARLDTDAGEDLPDSDKGQPPIDSGTGLAEPFDRTLARWLVLSEASNSINRCMGLPDLYPFVISPVAAEKLGFVHELLGGAAATKPGG
jgi:hypothetical protein